MKRNILWMRKTLLSTLIALVFTTAIVLAGKSSPIPTINQANPTTSVYLNPPTIDGTAIGVNNTVTVNLMIRDAVKIGSWQAGMIFNPTLLECTGFFVGEFLPSAGPTFNMTGTINNTAGKVRPPYSCFFLGDYWASGNGRLAYATFKVKAPSVSDIHLSDVKVLDYPDLKLVPVNIIDVYTVVVDTTSHTVVTVSNSTDTVGGVLSGLYGHSFNQALKELSFKVTGPHPGFSDVKIPKTLLPPPVSPYTWAVMVDGTSLSAEKITVTENVTHSSIRFTYSKGLHTVQITTRFSSSTISIALSAESISLGESVTISGAIDPVKPDVTVTIYNRTKGAQEWDTIATVETDPNSEYTYTWEPGKTGTYEVMASWEGDEETLRAESSKLTLQVKGKPGIPLEVVAIVVVAIIIIVAVVVYFVKFRKPK